MENQTVRTTITLPVELLESIDVALIEMTQDPEYQSQVIQMENEFATASCEALQLGESSLFQLIESI